MPTIEEIRTKAIPILQAHGAEYAALFGSAARGEAGPTSDIDILVRYHESPSLLGHIGIMHELQDVLQRKVDLVTEPALKTALAPRIKPDLIVLYGQPQRSDLR